MNSGMDRKGTTYDSVPASRLEQFRKKLRKGHGHGAFSV